VTRPLREMGATVVGRQDGPRLPLAIRGTRPLRGDITGSPSPRRR